MSREAEVVTHNVILTYSTAVETGFMSLIEFSKNMKVLSIVKKITKVFPVFLIVIQNILQKIIENTLNFFFLNNIFSKNCLTCFSSLKTIFKINLHMSLA